ncbi:MAG: class I SAM-dependent methyltransferase [Candidatus Daviesbacteria bacterium]|nr:class I SAM-dependent methyltransferase [Candidatus Daviesbacteria bacterium]
MSKEVPDVWRKYWETKPQFIPVNPKTDTISILTKIVIGKLKDRAGALFLDIGCGPGSRTIPIVGSEPNIKLLLLDQAKNVLNTAKDYASSQNIRGDLILADAFMIPIKDGSIDCVASIGLNEHFSDPARQDLICEMTRVVKPGGILALIVPNKYNLFHTFNKRISEFRGTWAYGPMFDFTPFELRARMEKAGLVDLESYGVGAYTSWIRLMKRENQRKYYVQPTPSSTLNNLLWRLDANTTSVVNRFLGREIMVIGYKP